MSETPESSGTTSQPELLSGLLQLARDMNGDTRKTTEAVQDIQGRLRTLEDVNKSLVPAVQKLQTLIDEYVKRPTTWVGVVTYFIDIMTRSPRDRTLFLLGIIAFILSWSNIISQFLLGTPELRQVLVGITSKLLPSFLTQ